MQKKPTYWLLGKKYPANKYFIFFLRDYALYPANLDIQYIDERFLIFQLINSMIFSNTLFFKKKGCQSEKYIRYLTKKFQC